LQKLEHNISGLQVEMFKQERKQVKTAALQTGITLPEEERDKLEKQWKQELHRLETIRHEEERLNDFKQAHEEALQQEAYEKAVELSEEQIPEIERQILDLQDERY